VGLNEVSGIPCTSHLGLVGIKYPNYYDGTTHVSEGLQRYISLQYPVVGDR